MNTALLEDAERHTLNNTIYHDLQKKFPPFEVNYFVAHFKHNSTLQYHIKFYTIEDIITLGLCLPASCSINDLSLILKKIFRDRIFSISDLYSMDFKLIEVKNLKDESKWLLYDSIFFICILALTFFIMIIGTIYDIFVYQKRRKYLVVKDKTIANVIDIPKEMEITSSSIYQESKIGQILMCFSIYTNTKIIFNTKLDADAIPAIHGLKFLSIIWIVFDHTVYFMLDCIDNKALSMRFTFDFLIQILTNIIIPVDTYFFLSGFLVAYLYLKDKIGKKNSTSIEYKKKLNEFFIHIIKRFIRLTPAYMMMIGIVQLNSAWYDMNSQFYLTHRMYETCTKYSWRNLLYINNLFDLDSMCMVWSWYVANDMQYFIIATALLILSTVYFYIAAGILAALLISSIVLTGYISYIYEFVPTLYEQQRLLNVLYYPPWIRIGPYIIGIITGYIIRRLNKKLVLRKGIVILCWCFSSACFIFVCFSSLIFYKQNVSILYAAIYVALSRTIWATGIAWIVIACFTEYGGIVNQLLSLKVLIPFSKLTYCVYLIHPFVIQLNHLTSETSIHLESLPVVVMFIGYFVISYICAYVLSLMAEVPYILLVRMFYQPHNNIRNYTHRKMS
ncbi:nose resistant to fluoxetine protein 6-like isoform X2 [Cataglyphis hispanica]|nr:nose resistant to fluoxetine protein 6-like isoform X2 [Cataglyphis hispanica]XP_050448545.1 nose resistant to fluoxetine protein 6-like isoform X2 [Cataglyphis hispanica]XP_050448553.1 nose resistant to fluoxetine protein 6-like isoform X2 [Cataglyphis hispanica]XP_050448561.1 nose resistant to fluoxetine protein 6-like isoform X2 [Cataglyphis hispanica]